MHDIQDGKGGGSHLIYPRTSKADLKRGVPVITRGEGVHLYDDTGKEYLDLVSGWTRPVHIGYGRKEMAQAVHDQLVTLHYFTTMQFGNRPAIELASVLSDITPGAINRFLFVCDGSEAVESALKLARHYYHNRGERWRFKVISRRGAFHGITGGAMRILGSVLPTRQIMEPHAPGAVFAESPYCYRCPIHLTYPSCNVACARDVERLIEFEDPSQIMAFIGEPIQQVFGAYAPPKEYWPIIREICDKHGILLIVDEVICGFGRTGKWFGIQHFDAQPDMMLMAKGISSGYAPLGALGATDALVEPVDFFNNLQTYMNHPATCAAGLKNIEILKRERLVENAQAMGEYFLEKLRSLAHHPSVGEVRGTGLWTAMDLTTDRATRALFPAKHLTSIVERAIQHGLLIKFMNAALEFAPPLIVTRSDIDEAIRILDRCLTEEERVMGL